jgi:hypothetical protein
MAPAADQVELTPETRAFYCGVLHALAESGVPFLVGGAYAFARYTGIVRHTKDFDLFVRPADRDRVLAVLAGNGCETDVPFPHWLAKARCGEDFVDVIYCSGNGVAAVDDEWFARAVDGEVLDLPVKLVPPEEMIRSKAFVQERERYDGADIAHLIRARGRTLDWRRLLHRFGPHWRVLFQHLIAFGFIYPGERDAVPDWLLRELWRRTEAELARGPAPTDVCRGTLLSRQQYLPDIECWGYADARLHPRVAMTADEIGIWTEAIDDDGAS